MHRALKHWEIEGFALLLRRLLGEQEACFADSFEGRNLAVPGWCPLECLPLPAGGGDVVHAVALLCTSVQLPPVALLVAVLREPCSPVLD